MQDLTEKANTNWEINIDGKMVSKKQLVTAWKFYQKMQLHGGETICPLCGCDFADNDLFVCEECEQLLSIDEMCKEHNLGGICQECCDECREQKAFEDAVNLEIDRKRGK